MSSFWSRQLHRPSEMQRAKHVPIHEQAHVRRRWKRVTARSPILIVLMFLLLLGEISLPFSQGALAASSGQNVWPTNVTATGLLQSPVYNLTFTNPDGTNVIREINVKLGQHVEEGTVLARLDPTLYERAVNAARHHVAASENRLHWARARLVRGIQFIRALINSAEVHFATSKSVLRATIKDAEARVDAAEATLKSDEKVLAATQKQSDAQIRAAEAQLVQSIAACRASSTTGTAAVSGTPTASVTPAATGMPTATETPVVSVTPAATGTPTATETSTSSSTTGPLAAFSANGTTPQDKSKNATGKQEPVDPCIQAAQTQYKQAVAAAQTAVATARAQVKKDRAALAQALTAARLEVVVAEKQVEDDRSLIPIAVFTPDPFVAARELSEAEEDLVITREDLRTARLNLKVGTVLIAPHDGVVTAINGTIGSVPGVHVNIAPQALGSADSGVFIQLVDLSHVDRLLLNVNEADIARVKKGQNVQFTLKAYPGRLFSGTVKAISPNGVVVNGAMTFQVIVRIDSKSIKGIKLYPNMTATATIVAG